MRILYDNLWDDYTITATSENSSYPATNTQDKRLSYYTRTTDVNDQYWTVDLGSAQSVDCIGIAGHNITSGATIRIEASDDNFTGIDFTSTVTDWMEGPIVHFFTQQSYRYWRFYIDDPSNTDLYILVGRFFLGTYLQVSPSSLIPFSIPRFDTSQVSFSVSGQAYVNEGITGQQFEYSFPNIGATMKSNLDTFYETTGIGRPFFFVNTENSYTIFPPMYCVLTNSIDYEYQGAKRFTYKLNLREVF